MKTSERYVVLGVAQARAPWFREVARWTTSSMLPMELVKAMSLEEIRVRLRSGRRYSALLVDDSTIGVDRDLVGLAADAGCAVVIIDSGRTPRAWSDLGAAAVLPEGFGRDDLLHVLSQVATALAPQLDGAGRHAPGPPPARFTGALVAVTGAGGVGTSTVAAALAQGLAADLRNRDMVCLADLARNGEQAMLHGSPDVVPGVVELVESFRSGRPGVDAVRRLTWAVPERGYHLLLGLRRPRDWTAVPPRALAAAIDGLRRGFRIVVADVDADLEGEQSTGSSDVEDRNTMARSSVTAADLVVVVGLPGMKGLHGLLRTTRDVLAHGARASSLLPLVNRSPRSPSARAELTSGFAALLGSPMTPPEDPLPTLLHLGERKHLEVTIRTGSRFPDGWVAPLAAAAQAVLDRRSAPMDQRHTAEPALVRVPPGSVGTWPEEG